MKRINWHEVGILVLRLLTRFVVVTAVAAILIFGFFRNTKIFDYMLAEEAPASIFWFVGVVYTFGFIGGLVVFVANFFYALTERDEELDEAQKEIAKLRRILAKYNKKHASSPADRILGEISPIGPIDDIQPRSDENEDLDIKPLQQMLREDASAKKQ